MRCFATSIFFCPDTDYYRRLGVSKTATDAEIKKQFYKLAKKYHPDAADSKPKDEAKFKQITEAYDILSNSETKTQYDASRGAYSDPDEKTYTYKTGSQGFGTDAQGKQQW